MPWYVDTSALVKLVVAEPESEALLSWLVDQDQPLVSSDLARTELMRAVRRAAPAHTGRARDVLDALVLLSATSAVFDSAGRLDPPNLRSLDAVHLSTALDLGDQLDGVVAYDDRLVAAAQAYGVPIVSPGAD